jgi:asparagine N-glycosylation enzyme membrane subunit Stt3
VVVPGPAGRIMAMKIYFIYFGLAAIFFLAWVHARVFAKRDTLRFAALRPMALAFVAGFSMALAAIEHRFWILPLSLLLLYFAAKSSLQKAADIPQL